MITTVVGSYPTPDWLRASGSSEALRDATVVAIRAQELAGIELVCDGEVDRWDTLRQAPGGMVERFVDKMDGLNRDLTEAQWEDFAKSAGAAYRDRPAGIVTAPIGPGRLMLVRDWVEKKALALRPLKVTLTSPYMLASVVADEHYRELAARATAFARVLAGQVAKLKAAALQMDEPRLPGHPEHSDLAAEVINIVLRACPARRKGVHLCFGNYGGQRVQQGSYRALLKFINRLACDHLVVETTRRPVSELHRLKEVDRRIDFGVGVIDVKDLQVETPEIVARRIETLGGILGTDRIAFVHPDCGLRNLPRSAADGKLRSLVLGRDLFCGRGRTSSRRVPVSPLRRP